MSVNTDPVAQIQRQLLSSQAIVEATQGRIYSHAPTDLFADLAAFAQLLEAEWYNGNLSESAYERLNADLVGMVAKHQRAVDR